MIERYVSPEPGVFEHMAALTLDAAFFRPEFHLCDKVAEYLADIVAQSHEDPARYANFSSQLINEMVELCFRSTRPADPIDFRVLKNDAQVRVCVDFAPDADRQQDLRMPDMAAIPDGHHPAGNLRALANAIKVTLHTETGKDNRVTLMADFDLLGAVR